MVTSSDIEKTLRQLDVCDNDTTIVHSSLKSFGVVDGGAQAVIDAFRSVLSRGTLVMPALRINDFPNAYKDWDIHKTPSDVGLITETFRKQDYVVRSDNPTHSVCACGVNAEYLTSGDGKGRPRIGVFGDMSFSKESAWQKLYDTNAKVVLLGVESNKNTLKHLAEYMLVNNILDALPAEEKQEAQKVISRFENICHRILENDWQGTIWPFLDGLKVQADLESTGKLRSALCGTCLIRTFEAHYFVDYAVEKMLKAPETYINCMMKDKTVAWVRKYGKVLL